MPTKKDDGYGLYKIGRTVRGEGGMLRKIEFDLGGEPRLYVIVKIDGKKFVLDRDDVRNLLLKCLAVYDSMSYYLVEDGVALIKS